MSFSLSLAVLLYFLTVSNGAPTSTASTISPKIALTTPGNAVKVSSKLISFSLEGDAWPRWAANAPDFSQRNEFFFNALKNLHDRTGSWPNIRVGANSADRMTFDKKIKFIQETVPPPTRSVPYPEAQNIIVGPSYYSLSKFLPSGTDMTWGFNFGANNLTLAKTELNEILGAFNRDTGQGGVKGSGVNLKFVELGNEPDLYGNNGHRPRGYNIQDYVTNWRHFISSLLSSTSLGSSSAPKIVALSLGHSDFGAGNFSPQRAIEEGIFDGNIKQRVGFVSQHHYSGGCCTARMRDLMNKAMIRSNLTEFKGDIAAVKATGIPYIFGETNTYFNHGVPQVSDAGGAAIWLADYTLFGATIGIGQMFFHQGVGYKYNLIQPVSLDRSVDDATPLSPPRAPHTQASYYGALIVNEFLGTSSDRRIVEIDFSSVNTLSGFALYSSGSLKRVVLINHDPFFVSQQGTTRPSLSVSLSSLGTKNVSVKKLFVPFATVQTGLAWAGQSFAGAIPKGSLQVSRQSTNQPIVVESTQIVLVEF